MNDYDSEVAELVEDIDESDDPSESDEERSRFRPFRPKVPSGKGLFKARNESKYVTQQQLLESLRQVGGQIKANGDATKAVSTRVNTLGVDVAKTRKVVGAVKKEVADGRMMSILPLLLQKPPALTITRDPKTNAITDVTVKSSSDSLLPLILMMSMGGMGGDEGKGSGDNSMMMMALVLSGGLGGGNK